MSTSGINTGLSSQIAESPSLAQRPKIGQLSPVPDSPSAVTDHLTLSRDGAEGAPLYTPQASPAEANLAPALGPTSATIPASKAELAQLVDTIVQAMQHGDNAVVSSALAELAYLSPNAQTALPTHSPGGQSEPGSAQLVAGPAAANSLGRRTVSFDAETATNLPAQLNERA